MCQKNLTNSHGAHSFEILHKHFQQLQGYLELYILKSLLFSWLN